MHTSTERPLLLRAASPAPAEAWSVNHGRNHMKLSEMIYLFSLRYCLAVCVFDGSG